MNFSSKAYSGKRSGPIIALTDFGSDSFYVGAMKGAIYGVDPGAVIIDLMHGTTPFAVGEASFVLATVFEFYPEGSVFLAVVDPGVGGDRDNLVFTSKNRYLVCPDNGIVSDIEGVFGIDSVFSISEDAIAKIRKHKGVGKTFLGRDVFGPTAAYLARGGHVGHVGKRVQSYERLSLPLVKTDDGYIRGTGRYVDGFGNVLTNISGRCLKNTFGATPLAKIRATVNTSIVLGGIGECFSHGAIGELTVILDSWDLVEITVNQGRAIDRFPGVDPLIVELTRTTG